MGFRVTITAVDSNILIDIVGADPVHGPGSRAALELCARHGTLIVCSEVVAEFASGCQSVDQALEILSALSIDYVDTGAINAAMAGQARGRKRNAGRVIADCLIAAHAAAHANQLLTRDAEFARMGNSGLVVVTPQDIAVSDKKK